MVRKIVWFIPLSVVITAFCGLVYVSVQQNYRQSANDPQIQMAEDAANALSKGQAPESVVPKVKVDVAKSLAPFIIVTDKNASVAASSVELDGKTPLPPPGVFKNLAEGESSRFLSKIRSGGTEERVTWQPANNVRIAAVVVKYDNGFVIASRSLREVENREESLELHIKLVWLAAMVATFISVVFVGLIKEIIGKKRR